VSYAWAGFGAAFGPVVVFSLFWGRMTGAGALAGMLAGATTVVLWKLVLAQQFGSALYEMIPGVLVASLAIVIGSLLSRTPGDAVRARHQQVQASLREQGY
jgi:sodium/proline symporter